MGKFNFKNYDRKNRNYGNNDLNIDRLSRELIDTPRRSTSVRDIKVGGEWKYKFTPQVSLTDQTLIEIRNSGLEEALEFVASHDVVDMNWLKEADSGMTIKFIYRKSE